MRSALAAGVFWLFLAFSSAHALGEQGSNLLENLSFEVPKEREMNSNASGAGRGRSPSERTFQPCAI